MTNMAGHRQEEKTPTTSTGRETPDIAAALARIARSIAVAPGPLAIVGIYTAGVPLARRLLPALEEFGVSSAFGQLDVALYRDDGHLPTHRGVTFGSEIDFDVDDRRIVLVDDVLFTGRTVRAAMDQLMDFGRPAKIELATLVDRGHRQLPIQADYIGFRIDTDYADRVEVELVELGAERDGIRVLRAGPR